MRQAQAPAPAGRCLSTSRFRWRWPAPAAHRDALADARVGAAVGQAQRRDAVAGGRDNGIHRVAAGAEGVGRIGVTQCMAAHVHRAAAATDEPCAGQRAATGQVQQCTGLDVDTVGMQVDTHRVHGADHAHQAGADILAVQAPALAIHGATEGNAEAGRAA
ncbi:hypothetical protein G6F32_014568 [Rhizopus arrhizus]|nr:hypothetical protein G6F32_014568 [Rhizopus arrhizus]